jgi:TolB protein
MGLLAGCAESYRARVPKTTMPALEPVRTPVSPAATDDAHASSKRAADGGAVAAAGRPTPPTFPPAAGEAGGMVSLWGDELIDLDHNAATPADGSGNLRQISFATEGSTFDPDVDRTGQWLVYASTRHRTTADIYLQAVGGTSVTQLTSDAGHDIMPTLDPTGQWVAFASERSGNWDIYLMGIEGGRPVQLTTDGEPELHPTWSPDGRHVAYCRFGAQSGRWEIWVLDVENPATPSFLTFGLFPQWSPDIATGKILFQRARERGSHYHSIWTIDYVGGEAQRPTEIISAGNAALINPDWSPDGQRIVFITVVDPDAEPGQRPGQSDVWVVNLDGTQRANLTNGDFANYQPVWAPGGAVYFVSDRSGVDNLWAVGSTVPSGPGAMNANSVVDATPEPGGQP